MNIVITNDDGYKAKGIKTLAGILSKYGKLTIVAPKQPQSGMSMAVTMGYKPIAVKHLGVVNAQDWWYLDGTPASCVKFAEDNILRGNKIDLVVSGINHGSNAATAAVYSGTLGAAMEGAVNGILSIGVSLDSFEEDPDFSAVEAILPSIIDKLLTLPKPGFGAFFNINFPKLPANEIKGIKISYMGKVHWEDEYQDYHEFMSKKGKAISEESQRYLDNVEPGEQIYIMAGDMTDNGTDTDDADHRCLERGYITITPHNIDNTAYYQIEKLNALF